MTTILDAPVTADGMGEPLDAHGQTAEVIADLRRLLPLAEALRHHHADRPQALPQFQAWQHGKRIKLPPSSWPRRRFPREMLGPGPPLGVFGRCCLPPD